MKVKHQWCEYHAKRALDKRVKNYKKKNKTSEYEDDLINYYLAKIKGIYKCKDFDQARKSIDSLVSIFEQLPKVIQNILSNFVIPNLKTLVCFLIDPKVDKTNNLCENMFSKTYPNHQKRKGKIKEGGESRCAIKERRWDKHNANF